MAFDITTEAVTRVASSPWSSIPGAYYVCASLSGANINYTVSVVALIVGLLQGVLVIRRHLALARDNRERKREVRRDEREE